MATRKKYSILNAIRALDDVRTDRDSVKGLEAEVSQEMERRCGRKCDHGGLMLPDAQLLRDMGLVGLRTSTAGQETFGTPEHGTIDGIGGHGANSIATDLRTDLFIDALTARCVFGRVGVQIIDGLVGDLAIPAGGEMTAAWLTNEGSSSQKRNPTLQQRTASPKTISAYTNITRRLMLQTSDAAEAFVVGILQNAIARGVEAAGFSGAGSSGVPCGIENTVGVQTVEGITPGAVTKADLVSFWSAMETENANTDAAAWIMSPACKGLLAKTIDYTAVKDEDEEIVGTPTAAHYLCENGKAEDYPVFTSNLCDSTKIYFADWSQLLLCAWRGCEILVDKYSQSVTGCTRVVAFGDADFIVRQPKAFVIGTALASE